VAGVPEEVGGRALVCAVGAFDLITAAGGRLVFADGFELEHPTSSIANMMPAAVFTGLDRTGSGWPEQEPRLRRRMASGQYRPMTERFEGHGGEHAARALRARGVEQMYTLIGGHIFALLDGAARQGIDLIDVRHEQAAAFAAEAHGKLAREPGVVAVDAGPGVLNTVNAIASAQTNGSPVVLMAGRPPRALWGRGALNEIDQMPVFKPLVKETMSVEQTAEIPDATSRALVLAATRHRGPVYLDLPMDAQFGQSEAELHDPKQGAIATEGDAEAARHVLEQAERPVLFLGSDVWTDGADRSARDLAEKLRLPVLMNGMGRGILPVDHALAFSAARGPALQRADVVVVAGTPLDFRVGYGGVFANTKLIFLADHPSRLDRNVPLAAGAAGPLADLLGALMDVPQHDYGDWVAELRAIESERRTGYEKELRSDASPIHPARVYGELVPKLPRDAIVIADGGDFASYAGKYVDVYEPGAWLDPGPYGCLGTSAGYALAAGRINPGRRIVVLLGDGAAGFSLADWDSLVRHGIDVTFVCGNNAGWVLEKQPMRQLFGKEVAADLRPETRYDEVMRAFGGHGDLVKEAGELGKAVERALATPGPSLVNVIIDPEISYPRGGSAA
jgi:thiamine pyrophosphate-dependent acetolactate synthase large subunit-like protein